MSVGTGGSGRILVSIVATIAIAGAAYVVSQRGTRSSDANNAHPAAARPGAVAVAGAGAPVLVGTNYSHVTTTDCKLDASGVLGSYRSRRDEARAQLQAMRHDGVNSLRLLVWHMNNPGDHHWGVVSSAGGRLSDAARDNLAAFLDDVRAAGFARITLSFSPQWTNDPVDLRYDPRHYEENWRFIGDVRRVALEHGPGAVRFDLLNEGAPSSFQSADAVHRMRTYIGHLWSDYTNSFGADDATVSAIAPANSGEDAGGRLRNLVETLADTGRPMPQWFEVHVTGGQAGVAHGLEDTQKTLQSLGLKQPVVVGEAPYDDSGAAASVAAFSKSSGQRLNEVLQWTARAGDGCFLAPPYRDDAYARALEPAA